MSSKDEPAQSQAAGATRNSNDAVPKKQGGYLGRFPYKRAVFDKTAVKATRFKGQCEQLLGHIYGCGDNTRQVDTYTKTTREIWDYVGRTYKYGGDARIVVQTLTLPTIKLPEDPEDGASKTALKLWDKAIDEYVRKEVLPGGEHHDDVLLGMGTVLRCNSSQIGNKGGSSQHPRDFKCHWFAQEHQRFGLQLPEPVVWTTRTPCREEKVL
jgi:hypothetical protein